MLLRSHCQSESELTMWSVSSLIKKSDFVFDNKMEKATYKCLEDLFKFIPASNKRFICELLKCIYTNNESLLQDQVLIHNRITRMPIEYSLMYILKTLLNYLCSFKKSQPCFGTSKKEAIRNFLDSVQCTSATNSLRNKRIECLFNNIQEIDLNDRTYFNLLSKCYKLPGQVNYTSEVLGNKTPNFMNPSFIDGEFQTFIAALDYDYTKSCKDREVEHGVNRVRHKKSYLLNCNNELFEINTSDSDEFSVSSSDEENYSTNGEYKNVISRYFDRKDEHETSESVVDFDIDNYIVFSEDVGDTYIALDKFGLGSTGDLLVDNYDRKSICLFGGDNSIETDSDGVSLSQIEAFSYSAQSGFSFQGVENPCFEDDAWLGEYSYIKMINDNWKINMEDVPVEPREAKRVSFAPVPTVSNFETEDDGYRYSTYVMDRIRFRNRILDLEIIMAPFLTPEHRGRVWRRNNSYDC